MGPTCCGFLTDVIAAGRLHEPVAHTSLVWVDPTSGTAKEFLTFPSSRLHKLPRLGAL